MLKRVLVVVLAKRVAPPRPSKSTKMASPSSTLAHASNASLASTIAPPAPSPKANNSGFIETLNPSAAPQDVALFLFAAYVLVSLRAYGVGSGYVLAATRLARIRLRLRTIAFAIRAPAALCSHSVASIRAALLWATCTSRAIRYAPTNRTSPNHQTHSSLSSTIACKISPFSCTIQPQNMRDVCPPGPPPRKRRVCRTGIAALVSVCRQA